MGWFWSSPSSSVASLGMKPTETSTLPATTTQPAAAPPAQQQIPPARSPSSSSSSSGDAEIQKFLEMLQGDDTAMKPSQPQQKTPSPTTPSEPARTASPSVFAKYKAYIPFSSLLIKDDPAATEPEIAAAPKKTRSPTSLAMSEHCLPTTMSCRDAFDYAWHCQTPGAQFNAVYRYGTMKNCSELWDDFWFCMRTKSFGPEMKAEAVKEYYRSKEEAKYGGGQPSSEDVWESRETRVEWDSEFRQSWEGPEQVSDEEFKRREVERRRQIREQLGLDEK